MKKLSLLLLSTVVLIACNNNNEPGNNDHQHGSTVASASKDTSKKSIASEVTKQIANAEVTIRYHAPGVRNRVIWGGLVPYDEVWVTGAHSATTLEVTRDFQMGDKAIKAGKYAIFTIPGKEEWTVILNSNWDQHLADEYTDKEDLVRFKVKPQPTQETVERLKYEIDQIGESTASITISWEKLRVPFQIELR